MSVNQPKFCFMTPIEAEIVKISLNGFITTKISYANMISDLCDELNADKTVVLNAIGSDTRIGNKYFRPGYSFGGPCFPRDTKALKLLVSQNGIDDDLLSATTKYNEYHIEYQANQLLKEDQDIYKFENVCYKENSIIPIIEESAKLKIANKLVKRGKTVIISDVNDIINEVKKEYGNRFIYQIIEPPNVQTIQTTNNVVSNNPHVKINEVYNFWNERPCNIRHSNKEIGTKEYFEEVSKRKYIVEPHIIDFANFKEYNGKDVLEVGCGIGTAAQSFIENGANYTGIDLSDRSIEIAKQRLNIFNLNGTLFQANIEELNNIKIKNLTLFIVSVYYIIPQISI